MRPRLAAVLALSAGLVSGCAYYPPPAPIYGYAPCAPGMAGPPEAALTPPPPPNQPPPGPPPAAGATPQGGPQCLAAVGGYGYPAYPYYPYPVYAPYYPYYPPIGVGIGFRGHFH